jgi:hypothetical protein
MAGGEKSHGAIADVRDGEENVSAERFQKIS